QAEEEIEIPEIRYGVVDGFGALWRFKLETIVKSDFTVPPDQIIRYPADAGDSKYTFSFWAFPEENYGAILKEYFVFCRKYYETENYRSNLIYVGYRVMKDQQSLLSYSWNGNMITIDPVSTANPGLEKFLAAYNQFSSDHGAVPLLNQTPSATRAQVEKALGARWTQFGEARKTFDPGNRFLNGYFRN